MNNRTIAKTIVAAGLAVSAWAAFAQEVILKVHHFLPPVATTQQKLIVPWCDKIAKESNNRMKCQIYPAMQLGGSPSQLFDQVRDGVVDLVWTVPTYQAGRFVKSEVFELPFMTFNSETAAPALWEYIQKNALDEFAGVKPIATHFTGGAVLFLTSKQVRSLEDMKGIKIRTPTRLAVKTSTLLGAIPVQMPAPALPEALAKSVVDGAMADWDLSLMFKLPEVTRVYVETPVGMPKLSNYIMGLFMSQAKYDSLPADLKKVIDDNSGLETSRWAGRVHDTPELTGRKIAEARNNTAIRLTMEEYLRWKEVTTPVVEGWIKDANEKGADGRALYNDAVQLLKKYNGGS